MEHFTKSELGTKNVKFVDRPEFGLVLAQLDIEASLIGRIHSNPPSTVYYPISNQVIVSGLCYLYYCLILYFLSILELTNYCFAKCILVFFHSAFGSVSGFHNTSLLSDPISESKDPVPIHHLK